MQVFLHLMDLTVFKKKGGKKGQVGDDGNCGCRQVHYKLDAVLERQEPTVSVSKLKKAQSAQMNTCRCNIKAKLSAAAGK